MDANKTMMYTDEEKDTQLIVQDALGLITNPTITISDVLTQELVFALCINKNKILMHAFQMRLEQEMRQIPLLDEPKNQLDAKIDNLLSFIAYTEPKNNSSINIPTVVNQGFELVNYTVQRINLTSDYFSTPYTCYGLLPNAMSGAQARLIFMGTTFPTAKGFAQALLADTAPGGGVGHFVYLQGQRFLQDWINQQFEKTQQAIHCCGQSLGGAMAMQTYVHQPNKVHFTAINPPFLTNAERRVLEGSCVNPNEWVLNNQIYSHVQDPIAQIGHWFPSTTNVCIHGTKNDFRGSELHKYFKAHAAQLTTQQFTHYNGLDYLKKLQHQSSRMIRHYTLKPFRAAAFFTFFTATSASSLPRWVGKLSGVRPTQEAGPQLLASTDDACENKQAPT